MVLYNVRARLSRVLASYEASEVLVPHGTSGFGNCIDPLTLRILTMNS